jgi:hypothetical protein
MERMYANLSDPEVTTWDGVDHKIIEELLDEGGVPVPIPDMPLISPVRGRHRSNSRWFNETIIMSYLFMEDSNVEVREDSIYCTSKHARTIVIVCPDERYAVELLAHCVEFVSTMAGNLE